MTLATVVAISFGVVGVLCLLLCILSIVLLSVPHIPQWDRHGYPGDDKTTAAVAVLAVAAVICFAVMGSLL